MKVINYTYSIISTVGTTGFASCVPESPPDLAEAVRILQRRPLDTFLHRHALGLLLQLESGKWQAYASACNDSANPILAALLLETAQTRPEMAAVLTPYVDSLQKQCTPWHEFTPETMLAAPRDHAAPALWHVNIHAHGEIPAVADAPGLLNEKHRLEKARGSLAAARLKAAALIAENASGVAPADFLKHVSHSLEQCGVVLKGEMRHEASLCPIALLRPWQMAAGVAMGRNAHTLNGQAIAYGRGLKLVQARISCHMEIIERICAHAQVDACGQWGSINGQPLLKASYAELITKGQRAIAPSALWAVPMADCLPLHWLQGETSLGEAVLVPAQAVFLFCNLDEVALFENIGSTGLASGASQAAARLHALAEIIERYAHATTPFAPESCFTLASTDPTIAGLLDDYRWRGIRVQFQDITPEWGFPVYRCFVQGQDGRIAQGTGAAMNGKQAALAALTETPWPYVWANPVPAPSGPGLQNLPQRVLEQLPNYSLGAPQADLDLLETALAEGGFTPVYVDISRSELPFPVCRAFVPHLPIDTELETGPSVTLLARSKFFPRGHGCA